MLDVSLRLYINLADMMHSDNSVLGSGSIVHVFFTVGV